MMSRSVALVSKRMDAGLFRGMFRGLLGGSTRGVTSYEHNSPSGMHTADLAGAKL
jgi:hypothetical protein